MKKINTLHENLDTSINHTLICDNRYKSSKDEFITGYKNTLVLVQFYCSKRV